MTVARAPVVRRLGCPACGGSLERPGRARVVRCGSCRVPCHVDAADAAAREYVASALDAAGAIAAAKAGLRAASMVAPTVDRAAFESPRLWLVPLYVVEGVGAARAVHATRAPIGGVRRQVGAGGVVRFVDDAGREVAADRWYASRGTVEVEDTRVVLRDVRHVGLAVDLSSWGIAFSDLLASWSEDVVPDGAPARAALTLAPQLSTRDMIEAARTAGGLLHADTDAEVVDVEIRLVFVPVWLVRFRAGGHPYVLRVDGLSGRVLSGRAPVGVERSVAGALIAAAYVGFPLGKLLAAGSFASAGVTLGNVARLLLRSPDVVVLIVPIALVLVLLPLAASWSAARYAAEVEFRRGEATLVELARPPATGIERLVARIAGFVERWIAARSAA
jgi:hypothetical protein